MRARATKSGVWRVLLILAVMGTCAASANAAKNSLPAQVTMMATMPATFSLQAASATVTGASGIVQVESVGRGAMVIRGRLRGQGGTTVVRVPVALAANTRSFVVRATMLDGNGRGTAYLAAPELMGRRMPLRGQTFLAMGVASNGRQFFALNHPLHSTLEIVLDVPRGETSNFRVALSMRELGY